GGRRVRIFDLEHATRLAEFPAPAEARGLAFGTNNGELYFVGYRDKDFWVGRFDTKTGKTIQEAKSFPSSASVDVSPDGTKLLVARFGAIDVRSAGDLSAIWNGQLRGFSETRAAYSGDGTRIAVGDSSGFLAVCSAKTGAPIGKSASLHMQNGRLF